MASRSTTRPHLLVVDDDPHIREALSAALADRYQVHPAGTGREARAVLERRPIGVIVLDAFLEDEDGLDLIPQFRALSSAPILILTAHGSEELAIRAVRAHADDYLKKPVDVEQLRAAVARLAHAAGLDAGPVAEARRLLDTCPTRDLAPGALAAAVGVSERHLRRQFRAVQGVTPRRYLIQTRLRRAAELLRTTPLTVEQIALSVGYTDVRRFRRSFTAWAGMTPTEYRQAKV